MGLWILLSLLTAVIMGYLMRFRMQTRHERHRSAPVRRLLFMLLVTGLILAFSMHYRSESMFERGRDDAFRESYLAGQAQRAADLPPEEPWKDSFDIQSYYDHARGPFNDITPYCHGRMLWRGSGYEKGYLGQETRIWEQGGIIDLTVPVWQP